MSTMCKVVFFLSNIIYQYCWGTLVIPITLSKGYVLQSTSHLRWRNGLLCNHNSFKRVQVVVNSIILYGDILLHSKILLCTSAKFIGMLSYLQRGRMERRQGRSQMCEGWESKTMFATTFLATIKKNWIFTMKAKCSGKIGIRVCFEDRNYFFLACTWIYNAINKCKFLSSNIILWSKHHSSFSCFSNKISSIWFNCHRGTFFKNYVRGL